MNNLWKLNASVLLVTLLLFGVIIVGWGMNVYKFATSDWEAPFAQEAIRGAGLIVVPVGAIIGYIDIEDGKENDGK